MSDGITDVEQTCPYCTDRWFGHDHRACLENAITTVRCLNHDRQLLNKELSEMRSVREKLKVAGQQYDRLRRKHDRLKAKIDKQEQVNDDEITEPKQMCSECARYRRKSDDYGYCLQYDELMRPTWGNICPYHTLREEVVIW